MSSNVPLIIKLLASSVSVANRAGKIVRDVMSKGELGIVEKVCLIVPRVNPCVLNITIIYKMYEK